MYERYERYESMTRERERERWKARENVINIEKI